MKSRKESCPIIPSSSRFHRFRFQNVAFHISRIGNRWQCFVGNQVGYVIVAKHHSFNINTKCNQKHLRNTNTYHGKVPVDPYPLDKMPNLARVSFVAVPSKTQRNFVWIFKPIVYMMRSVGIELDCFEGHTTNHRIALLLFGTSIFLYTVSVVSYSTVMEGFESTNSTTSTYDPSADRLQTVIGGFIVIAYALVLFPSVFFRWMPLWKKMADMEQNLHYLPAFSHKQRNVLIAVIVSVVFLVLNSKVM